jgi:hypothetical protein
MQGKTHINILKLLPEHCLSFVDISPEADVSRLLSLQLECDNQNLAK